MRCAGRLEYLAVAAAMLAASPSAAFAQAAYPAKPIRAIVTFPPGGSTDVLSRVVGQKLAERWGQPWVFDNRPGAGGQIAVEQLLKAPADGYTLLVGTSGVVAVNPSLYKKLAYDPVRDLAPIVLIGKTPMVLMVPATWQGTVKDLIHQSKAKPGQLSYGHGGNGTAMHLVGEMFKAATGADLTPVPFKTSAEVIATLPGGQLHAGWVDSNFALLGQKGGRVRAIAVGNRERSAVLPGVPTVAESGFPGFEAQGWFGFFARSGTPAEIVQRINAEARVVLELPDVRERIHGAGNETWWSSPEDFAAFIRTEMVKWGKAVKQSGASAN